MVLRDEAEIAAHVLPEHPAAVHRSRDVRELRVRREQHLPPVAAEPVAPVRLLAEEEKALVEQPDLVNCGPAREHDGAHHEVRLPHVRVVETTRVEGVQRLRARSELAQEQVLGGEAPRCRKAAHRGLKPTVGIAEARTDDGRPRMRVGELGEPFDRVAERPGVGVEDEDVRSGCLADAAIPARSEPAVLLLDQPNGGKPVTHERDRPVRRAVVHDNGLVARDALEALLEPRQRVVRNDRDGHVAACHECSAGTQCGPPHERS